MDNHYDKSVFYWLMSGVVLIFIMVVLGGITRLTHSGLSMVDWNLFMDMIPPLNDQQWMDKFEQYKQYPEYQLVNFNFSLQEFKSIFFWEYIHRLTGRILGLVFFIPFIYFLIKGRLKGKLLWQSLILMGLGGLQGFVGWWMVKSGLVKNPDVSHYRLATHLLLAFLTFAYTFWVALEVKFKNRIHHFHSKLKFFLKVIMVLVILQITYGAFVAGLNAGFVYNTWPKMGDVWIAENVTVLQPFYLNFLEGLGGVQFIHRYLAVLIALLIIYVWFKVRTISLNNLQKLSINALLFIVVLQFVLGVFTLIYAVPVWLGVVHQVGAFFLLASIVFALRMQTKF
jgi:cytochrome c oxidase assembly protein subunit 15